MSAAPDYPPGWPSPAGRPAPPAPPVSPARPAEDLGELLAAASTAVADLAGGADLGQMADRDAAAVMGTLTTLVGQLDGLRVQVACEVRDREICGLRGVRTLAGWLHADARLADDARKIGRLAAMGPALPKVTALLAAGTISLTQAATACWQIAQLPHLPVPPDTIDPPGPGDPAAGPGSGAAGPGDPDAEPGAAGDHEYGAHDGDADGPRDSDEGGARDGDPGADAERGPDTGAGPAGPGLPGAGGTDGGDAWAGLWRAGDVHAAADELFAAFLPGLDSDQLRQMGAHLREAADSQHHAGDDSDDYARRGLRISRSLGGAGEISGRLHAEAAEQVIAAFEELGCKTGPDDKRTKAQRWADVLARLAATTPDLHPAPPSPGPASPAGPAGVAADPDDDHPCDVDSPSGHNHHGEDHHSSAGHKHGADGRDHTGTRRSGASGTVPAAYQRPRVIVTVPLSTLLGQPLAPGATLGSGTPLTAEAARRLACDAEIIRLITGPADRLDGDHDCNSTAWLTELMAAAIAQLPPPLGGPSAVLDIGRKSPGWTPRQRDALYVQYGGHCGFGRCGGQIDVIHHIIHWLHGGKTRIINGFPCCKYHHWLLHEGGWRIKKHRDGEVTIYPPPPRWQPGTIYRRGKPVSE